MVLLQTCSLVAYPSVLYKIYLLTLVSLQRTALNAIRDFEKHDGIRVQALELLTCVVDFVAESSDIPKILNPQELIHQLVLNGCTSTFPSLLTFYADSKNEMSTRRTISCIMFLLKNSAKEVAMTLITVISLLITGPQYVIDFSLLHFKKIIR